MSPATTPPAPCRSGYQLGLSVLLFTVAVMGALAWLYLQALEHTQELTDERLLAGAAAVPHVLADDFHDRAVQGTSITKEEDERNIAALSSLARQAGFAFLYTVIVTSNQVFITSSSASEEELQAGEEVHYFDSYNEADFLRTNVFSSSRPTFLSYSDRWGSFRAAVLAETSPEGRPYLAAAEMEISTLQARIRSKMLEALAIALIPLLFSLPVIVASLARLRHPPGSPAPRSTA